MASRPPSEPPLFAGLACRSERFVHGETAFELVVPEQADALIDEAAFAADERLPYWADLWPSAKALARFVLDGTDEALGLSGGAACGTIELGCGIGLVSLALRARGFDVIATDYEPMALQFVQANAVRNAAPRLAGNQRASRVGTIATMLLDWRSPPDDLTPAGLVVAADVLYEERHAIALADVLPRVVGHNGIALIADPGRRWLEFFLLRMRSMRWSIEDAAVTTEPGTAAGASPSAVRIVRVARAG